MSDPVTNVEIEDVLSSIRRLVSDGDKARTRDPAPVEPPQEETQAVEADAASEEGESNDEARPEKLVLTPAFMIVDNDAPDEAAPEEGAAEQEAPEPELSGAEAAEAEEEGNTTADTAAVRPEPLVLPDPVEPVESAPVPEDFEHEIADEGAPEETHDAAPATETSDRASLVATIAELEAAVSGSEDEYELDGSEVTGETIAWPGAMTRNFEDVEDAEMQDEAATEDQVEEAAEPREPQESKPEDGAVDPAQEAGAEAGEADTPEERAPEEQAVDTDVYEDDDLDDLLEGDGVAIDEEALRELVANVVREELTGPLGERITRNVRKLVRREIYRILSSQEFD